VAKWLLALGFAVLTQSWASAFAAGAPGARLANRCDVRFDRIFISQAYDPLSPQDYVASFTARAHRSYSTADTDFSALLLRHRDYRMPTQVFVISDDGSGIGQVVHDRPGPSLDPGLVDAREIDLRFDRRSGSSGTRTIEMQLRIPAGTEIPPGLTKAEFDVKYLCDFRDQRPDRGYGNHAFVIYFRVDEAVQASLTGAEPDFGEIGGLSDLGVAMAPPSTTQRSQYMRVASTGPYQVDVVSQNGWRMTATGAPTANPSERIAYRYELLGQTLDSSRPNFTPVRCETAGVTGVNIRLNATLTQGGKSKVPSPNYRDIITITVAPLAWGIFTQRCG
jgi:hypothetical protein